jgi:hypothetical protein
MPITPFHLGPGLAIKALAGERCSLMVFGFGQVVMDLEPLVRIARGDGIVHGFTHTYLGATLVAVVSIVVGRPVCQLVLESVRPDPRSGLLTWLFGETRISWGAAAFGAFMGTYSHVLLDSVMHADMDPLAPWAQGNALLHCISVESLHVACVLSGGLGVLLMAWDYLRRRAGES